MVNVILNNKAAGSVTYNVGSDTMDFGTAVPDSIEQLAGQVGLVDTAQQLNQEAQEFDQQLREEQFNPQADDTLHMEDGSEEFEPPKQSKHTKPRKKHKAEKRIEDMVSQFSKAAQERDQAYEELTYQKWRAEELEKELLQVKGNAYNKDIDTVTDILVNARRDEDYETEKEATKYLSQLQHQQMETQRNLQQAQQQEVIKQRTAPDPKEALIKEYFDPREIQHGALEDWLTENPECNPYNPDFDPDYAQEVTTVKKNLNKWLTGQRQKNIIGTDEYYDILNESLDIYFGRTPPQQQQSAPPQPQQRFANPERQTQVSHMYKVPLDSQPRSQVSAVNRSGYATAGGYNSSGLPDLDDRELGFARSWPVYDERGNQITNENVKIQRYREEKARMMKGR